MPDEEKELRYEDIDWGKTPLQPDVTYIPELRLEDIDVAKIPYETLSQVTPKPKKKRAVKPKPAQKQLPTTFYFGPSRAAQKPTTFAGTALERPSGFIGTPLGGARRGYFDIPPTTAEEWAKLTPQERLAFNAARERREGRVIPSMRAATSAEIGQVREIEEREKAIRTRLEGRSIFGIELPVPDTGLESIENIRRGIGSVHDVLSYQIPSVFLKGLASTPEGLAEIARYGLTIGGAPGFAKLREDSASPMLRRFTQKAGEVIEEAFPTREVKHPTAQIVGSAAQFIIPGGAAAKVGISARAVAGALGASMNVQQIAQEMDRAGVDPARRDWAIGLATLTGLTEMVGLGAIIDKFGVRQTFTRELLHIAEEGGQEAVQQWLNNLNAKLVGGWAPDRQLTKGIVEATILGLGGGALFAGINRAAIKDRERAMLRAMGRPAAPEAEQPLATQMELKFEDVVTPEVSQAIPGVTPVAPDVTPEVTEKGPPELVEQIIPAPDITSFKVTEAKPRRPKKDRVTRFGPRVPIDVIPVDDLFGKSELSSDEREAAESKAIEAVGKSLEGIDSDTGRPSPIPVPAPPLAAIIGPPGARGVARVPDVNLVKDRLYTLNSELRNLEVLARQSAQMNDTELLDAITRRGQEISSDIHEHVNFIEQNGQDGETFEILPAETPGQAPVMTVPGWVMSAISGGEDHMIFGGIAMGMDDLNDAMSNISQFAPSPNAELKANRAVGDMISQAEAEGLNSITFVHQWQPDEKRAIVIPHETFHAAQYKLAAITGALNRYLDFLKVAGEFSETMVAPEGPWHLHAPAWAKSHPIIQRIASDPYWGSALRIKDVDIYDAVAVEAPAYIAGGDGYRLGLTEDEQVEFLLDYIEHLAENHGVVVLDTFERVARLRPEIATHLQEVRNKYELWKQSRIEDWYESIKAFTAPIIEEFTGFTQERLQSGDPLEGILGPRKAGTKPPTGKTAARLVGKDIDKETAAIREALFVEREGWKNDESWTDHWSLSEEGGYAGVWRNVDNTWAATVNSKTIGDAFSSLWEAKDAAQKQLDRIVPSRQGLVRRGLEGLVNAIEQRLVEINNDKGFTNVPITTEDWASTLNDALWGTDTWTEDPILSELAEYVKEAYPESAKQIGEGKQRHAEEMAQTGWEGKSKWDIEYEEKEALERISGPDIRFTDIEFTEADQKRLKKLNKKMEKYIREQGYATTPPDAQPIPGVPTIEDWMNENLYPFAVANMMKEHPEDITEWRELKDREYQSKGGRRGLRALADVPLDPRIGLPARSEGWEDQSDMYEVGTSRLRTADNRYSIWTFPSEKDQWKVELNGNHIGYYPNEFWAKAAGERALDKIDVSWQSVYRRKPELANRIKTALIKADPQITYGSMGQIFDRMDRAIKDAVYKPRPWSDHPELSEYKEYLREMFPEAVKETATVYRIYEEKKRQQPYRGPEFPVTDEEYAEREREALAAIRDPRAETMAQIRKELAEEKKQRASEPNRPTLLKALVDPATAKAGDRIISKTSRKAGEITNLRTDEEGMWAEVKFDDGETVEQHIAELKVEPPEARPRQTNKVVPQTEAQKAVADSPVISSAQENLEQLILPGMDQILTLIKENRPASMVEFDKTLNKLLESKGIRPDVNRRPFIQVLEGLIKGNVKADELAKILEENDLTIDQFTNEFKATALESENSSKQLMRMKMRWLKAMKKNPDLANTIVFTPGELFKSVMEDINNTRLGLSAWQRASNFIRMLMLSDINTAAVNALMTAGRIPLAAGVHGFGAWMKTRADGKARGLNLGQRIQEANQQALDAMRVAGNILLTMNPVDIIQNLRKTGTSRAEHHTHIYNELVKVFPDLEMKVRAPGIGLEPQAKLTDQIDVAKKLIADMRTKGARESSLKDLKIAEDRMNRGLEGMGRVARGFEVALEIVLSPMRWQEWFFRKPMFISYLDLALRRRNMDLEDLVRTKELESIPEEALTEAIDEALDFTYAYMPKADGPGFEKSAHHLIKGINELKGVSALIGAMFPRAIYNGMKFTYEYGPWGAYTGVKKMLRPEFVTDPVTNEEIRKNPLTQKDYDRFAKAILGTIMYVAAANLIAFGLIGDEWWQVRTPKRDKNGKPVYVDIRRYQPFSTFVRITDIIVRALNAGRGMGDLQLGKEIREAITGLRNFPGAEEYVSATFDMWNDQPDETNTYQKAATSMGVGVSFLTRPFVNLRRAVATFDEDEQKRRDVKGTGILGPLMDNVPWLRQKMLPEYVSMTEKPPIHMESYPGLAFAGLRLIPSEGFAGREWRRLGFLNRRFLAPDPNPAINRRQNEVFQKIISSAGDFAQNNPAYLKLDDKGKAAYWERLVDVLAPVAREVGETADPKEAAKREFNRGLGIGPLQKKSLGLTNIFDRKPPSKPLEQREEIERLSRQAVQ